jgi:transcription antitermination factor NusG
VVPEEEIRAIQQVLQAQLPARSHPYLREGQRVRITGGPLAGVEGIFLQEKPERGVLVLSIELLQRSMAIEVDCAEVAAA